MENTFSALELEEPSASPLGAEPDKYQPKVTFKLQHSEGEEKTVGEMQRNPKDATSNERLTILCLVRHLVFLTRHV